MAAAAAAAVLSLARINDKINAADAYKDVYKPNSKHLVGESLEKYIELASTIFATHITSITDYNIVLNEVKDIVETGKTFVKYNICTLQYFQNQQELLIPRLTDPPAMASAESLGMEYAFQDSGKRAAMYNKTIKYVITPGTFLDPAARAKSDSDVLYMEPVNIKLNKEDFKKMGNLEKFIEKMEVSKSGTINKFKFTCARPLSNIEIEIKDDYEMTDKSDNNYIKGNYTKNEWLDSNLKEPLTQAKKDEAIKYILMKLLGDFLQVYYARIYCDKTGISQDNVCLFTVDSIVAQRAKLYNIPCVYEARNRLIEKGVAQNIFIFEKAAAGRGATFTNINNFQKESVKKHNKQVIDRLNQLKSIKILLIDKTPYNISSIPKVIQYIDELIQKIEKTTEIINGIVPIHQSPQDYCSEVWKYAALDIIVIKESKSGRVTIEALNVTIPFPLLESDNDLNTSIIKNQETTFPEFVKSKDAVRMAGIAARARESAQPVPPSAVGVGSKRKATGAPGSKPAGHENKRSKGGYQGCAIDPDDIYYTDEITLPSDDKCPSDAVLEIIGKINEPLSEFIFTLMYPYFRALGVYSIKPEFYEWANNKIKENINKPQQFVTFDAFKEEFEKIHGAITTDDVDEEIERAEPPNNENNENNEMAAAAEETAAPAQQAVVEKLVKPNESSSSSGATFGQAISGHHPPSPINTKPKSSPPGGYPTVTANAREITPSSATNTVGRTPMSQGVASNGSKRVQPRLSLTDPVKQTLFVTPVKPPSPNKNNNNNNNAVSGGGGNRPRHKTRLRRKSKKLRKYRKTRKLRRNKSTK